MNKEKIDNEHLESLEVFMEHHYLADNGHYQWVKKRFKELQQENKQLEEQNRNLNEEIQHIKYEKMQLLTTVNNIYYTYGLR